MKKKKANMSILKALWVVLIEMLSSFKYNTIKELNKIATVTEILIPVILSQMQFDIVRFLLPRR